ncbi:MAG: cell division ATP-binding protein FtsE [Candidatus Hydrogenedentota bacterium]
MNVQFCDVSKVYTRDITALHNLKVNINQGEFVFVIGPSGAGKTTFLRLMYRDIIPSKGQILVDNKNISRMRESEVPYLRRRMGIIFQDFKLLYTKTVFENVAFALKILGKEANEVKQRTYSALEFVKLQDKRNLNPYKLSGGEQQRTAIARAIVNQPELILADEPTGNLDDSIAREIFELFLYLNSKNTTVIIATHNIAIAKAMNTRVIYLKQGELIADGFAEDVL